MTCIACPEQYDAFDEAGRRIGYLRLRNGRFRVDFPDCGGETLYEVAAKGDGSCEDEERDVHLRKAVMALEAKLGFSELGGTYRIEEDY